MIYKVKNMACAHCVAKINKQLEKFGINATVDLASKTITSDDGRIIEVIKSIGYEIESLSDSF